MKTSELPNMPNTKPLLILKQLFGQTKSRLEFTMKTLDGNYTVGTDTKDYN